MHPRELSGSSGKGGIVVGGGGKGRMMRKSPRGRLAALAPDTPEVVRRLGAQRQLSPGAPAAPPGLGPGGNQAQRRKLESLACAAGEGRSSACPGARRTTPAPGRRKPGSPSRKRIGYPYSPRRCLTRRTLVARAAMLAGCGGTGRAAAAVRFPPQQTQPPAFAEGPHVRLASCVRYPSRPPMAPDGWQVSATLNKCRTAPACIAFAFPPLGSVTLDLPPWR